MGKLKFSGHESFVVRTFWPKKGYDFVKNGGKFNNENSVVELGVGKNMVSSINFWMKSLGLIDDTSNNPTEIAEFLLGEPGADPYLEDIGSIWLLHYYLIKANFSSIYSTVFNLYRKERSIFTKKQLASYIKRLYTEKEDPNFNINTIEKDINVLCKLYNQPDYKSLKKDFEDEISSLMLELELMSSNIESEYSEGVNKKQEWFYLQANSRLNLPYEIVLFSILDQFKESENISFRRLEIDENSPGMVFVLNKDGLYKKLKEIEANIEGAVVSETAGNIVLTLPVGLNKWNILKNYYAS